MYRKFRSMRSKKLLRGRNEAYKMERDCDVSYVYFATLNDLSPDVVYFCIELQCCHWNHEEFNFHWTGTQLEKVKEISL